MVVVDEAGMVGTRKLARLLAHARHWDAQVVLVGDPRQLPEVEAGGAFGTLAKALPVVELTENRRQREPWERQALAQLRAGPVGQALEAFENAGRVMLAPSAEAAREAMVGAWWQSVQSGEEAMMYALRRADVDDLNARARARRDAAGQLGPERLVVAGREFATGDKIMCLRNDRRLGVRNGSVATIASVDPDLGAVTLSEGAVLPPAYLGAGHLTHAYASTVHKAQGATVDRAFLLGSDQLYREAGYVGLSRARLSNQLFVVAEGPGRRLADVLPWIGASRAQHMALEHLEGPSPDLGRQAPATLLADPPDWALAALGPVPVTGLGRERWAERAAAVARYREAYGIDDPKEALGPRPLGRDHGHEWELARLALAGAARSPEVERGLAR